MPLISALIDFVPGTVIRSSEVDSNFDVIKTAFNDSAVLTDVAREITVTHTYTANQIFEDGIIVRNTTGVPAVYTIWAGPEWADFSAALQADWAGAIGEHVLLSKNPVQIYGTSFFTESASNVVGIVSVASTTASLGALGYVDGMNIYAETHLTVGQVVGLVEGLWVEVAEVGAGTITEGIGVTVGLVGVRGGGGGAVTTAYGFRCEPLGGATNNYGLRINDQIAATNNFNIWSGPAWTALSAGLQANWVGYWGKNVFVVKNPGVLAGSFYAESTSNVSGLQIVGAATDSVTYVDGADIYAESYAGGGEIVATATALYLATQQIGAGTITTGVGLEVNAVRVASGGGVMTNAFGIKIAPLGGATYNYGINIGRQTGATHNYNIWSGSALTAFSAVTQSAWGGYQGQNAFMSLNPGELLGASFYTENAGSITSLVVAGISTTTAGYCDGIEVYAHAQLTVGLTVTQARALYGFSQLTGAGAITTAIAVSAGVNRVVSGGGAITTSYGLYVEDQTGGTTNYNIWSGPLITSFSAGTQSSWGGYQGDHAFMSVSPGQSLGGSFYTQHAGSTTSLLSAGIVTDTAGYCDGIEAYAIAQLTVGKTLTTANAVFAYAELVGAGTITDAIAIAAGLNRSSGGGTITNSFGVYIANQSYGTNKYNLWSGPRWASVAAGLQARWDGYFGKNVFVAIDPTVDNIAAASFYTDSAVEVSGIQMVTAIRDTAGYGDGLDLYVEGHLAVGKTLTTATGLYVAANLIGAGTITTGIGIDVGSVRVVSGGGAMTTAYGIKVGLLGGVTSYAFYTAINAAANQYAFYSAGTAQSRFGGAVTVVGTLDVTGAVTLTTALGPTQGGTGLTSYTLGDTIYASAANTLAKLAGQITTTKKYLQQVGSGAVSAAPSWQQIAYVDISGTPTLPTAAVQADQETATSLLTYVQPGVQHYHPSAIKFWVKGAGGSTTINLSYNVTSVANTGTGRWTVTIGTDFSGAHWCCQVTTEPASNATLVANRRHPCVANAGQAAGTVEVNAWDAAPTNNALANPTSWYVCGMGDH